MTTYKVWNGTSWIYIDSQNYDARYVLQSSKGSNSGVASLDSSGHIPSEQLPSSIVGAVSYKGTFDPTSGAPTPAAQGYYYVASGAGTISATSFATGDWLVYTDESAWDKLENSSASVTWSNVSDKPASYTPDTHDNTSHSVEYITVGGVTYEALLANDDIGTGATQVAAGNHTHSGYQPLDGDLTSIAGLSGSAGLLRKTAANTWSLDTNTYLTELSTVGNATNWDTASRPSFAGNALKYLRLNEAGNAFEFATVASGGGTWGSITGNLSDQTDLNAALDGKATKTDSDLTLYVYEDATGDADGSSKANGFTTLQDAIDAIPDVAQNVTIIVSKGSTNYLGQTTTIQKASVKSLTIRGEYYWYANADANAVAGKIVDADGVFTGMQVGDRVVCMHYSGTVGSSSIDDYFYATITEVGEGYVQTSEGTKVPTTGWKYLINQTVFDGNSYAASITGDLVTATGICLTKFNKCFEVYLNGQVVVNSCICYDNRSSITSYTLSKIYVLQSAVIAIPAGYYGMYGDYGPSVYAKNTIFAGSSPSNNIGVRLRYGTNTAYGLYCGFFSLYKGIASDESTVTIQLSSCYIDSTVTTGAYGYNITLVNCTNNAETPVYNLTSGGSIEAWDGQALPSIADATGGQVLALKSDKSALEFATVDLDTLGAASSTTATQSIYVDAAATGDGTGVDWTNAFTTIQAAVDSLPGIINHAVTIYVRKGTTPYRETVTVQRVIAAGSLTIRGEYYHTFQAASNSTANRLVKNASDDFTDVEVGDVVYLMSYSGTYQASAPSGCWYGTVSNVDNKASGYVTISMDSSITPTTGWHYVICKTEISGSDDGTNPTRSTCLNLNTSAKIHGIYFTLPNSICALITAGINEIKYCIFYTGQRNAINIQNKSTTARIYNCGIFGVTHSSGTNYPSGIIIENSISFIRYTAIKQTTHAFHVAMLMAISTGYSKVEYCYFKSLQYSTSGNALYAGLSGILQVYYSYISGYDSGNKIGTGFGALAGGIIQQGSNTINAETITTQKSPANWAATTDGSYIE